MPTGSSTIPYFALVRKLSHSHLVILNQYPSILWQIILKVSSTSVFQGNTIFRRTQLTRLMKKDPENTYFLETLDQTKEDRLLFCRTSKQDFTWLTYIKTLTRVKMSSKLLTTLFFVRRASRTLVFHNTHLGKYLFPLAIPAFISPNYLLSKSVMAF